MKPALSHIDCRKVPKYQKKVYRLYIYVRCIDVRMLVCMYSIISQLDRWYSKYAHLRGDVKPYKTKFLDFHDKHLPEMIAQFPDQTRTKEQYYRTEVKIVDAFI